MRRIELQWDEPTEDGDTCIRLLTNVPAERMGAKEVAGLYRRRWSIEGMFGRLESVLHSEVSTLSHPRAALLAFGVAVMAYNVLAVLLAAVEAEHHLEANEVSSYDVAGEVKATYVGMMIAIPEKVWTRMEPQTDTELSQTLLGMARQVNPAKLRKHPRGPKKKVKKGDVSARQAQRHVSTARVLPGRASGVLDNQSLSEGQSLQNAHAVRGTPVETGLFCPRRLLTRSAWKHPPAYTLKGVAPEAPPAPEKSERDSTASAAPEGQTPKKQSRRPTLRGAKALPAHLERREVVVRPSAEECTCPEYGEPRKALGEDVSQRLELEPARFYVRVDQRYGVTLPASTLGDPTPWSGPDAYGAARPGALPKPLSFSRHHQNKSHS